MVGSGGLFGGAVDARVGELLVQRGVHVGLEGEESPETPPRQACLCQGRLQSPPRLPPVTVHPPSLMVSRWSPRSALATAHLHVSLWDRTHVSGLITSGFG